MLIGHQSNAARYMSGFTNLNSSSEQAPIAEFRRRKQASPEQIIQLVLLSMQIRSASNLEKVLINACKIVLPASIFSYVQSLVQDSLIIPDKGGVSRARLHMDVAHMLWWRCFNFQTRRKEYVRYLAWDSSVQYGRDYENIVSRSVLRSDLVFLLRSIHEMRKLWIGMQWDNVAALQAAKQRELELMKRCRELINVHTAPATLVGFGNSGFAAKLKTLVHALRLETFMDADLVAIIDEYATSTQDYGTEKAISRLKPTNLSRICPHFTDCSQAMIDMCHAHVPPEIACAGACDSQSDVNMEVFEHCPSEHLGELHNTEVFEDVPGRSVEVGISNSEVFEEIVDAPQHILDLGHMLESPPAHHINDSATSGLGEVMPHWNDHVYTSQNICRIIKSRAHRPRLLESCFSSGLVVYFQEPIKKFRGWIHIKRWATLIFSIPELQSVERAMRPFFDKRKFQGSDAKQREDTLKLATVVDAGVKSPFYWAYLVVQEAIACIERRCTQFCELCPCHFQYILRLDGPHGVLPDSVLKEMQCQWSNCPFRGMVVAELAEEFFIMFGEINQRSSAELMAKLPPDIEDCERVRCLTEFESGRAHLNCTYVLKLSHLHSSPYALFKMSHLDRDVVCAAGDVCMASESKHPRIRRLQQPPLAQQYKAFKQGADLFDDSLVDFCEFVAELRFSFSTDRPSEGQHAKFNRGAKSAPMHTEQYASFLLRCPELELHISKRPNAIVELAWCLQQVNNPRRCTEVLGLSRHPCLTKAWERELASDARTSFYRNTMHAKVIYHADVFTLYTEVMPDLEFWYYDGGGDKHEVVEAVLDVPTDIASDVADAFALTDAIPGDVGGGIGSVECTAHSVDIDSDVEFARMVSPAIRSHIMERWGHIPGTIFSIKYQGAHSHTRSIADVLRSNRVTGVAHSNLPLTMHPDGSMRLYFEVVRWNPSKVKRTRVEEESGIGKDAIAISPRRVLKQDLIGEQPSVSTSGVAVGGLIESGPLLLGMSSLNACELQKMMAYPSTDHEVKLFLKDACVDNFTVLEFNILLDVLSLLMDGHQNGGVLFDFDGEHESYRSIVQECVRLGLVCAPHSANQMHRLSDLGIASIESGVQLKCPVLACDVTPNRSLQDFNTWELVHTLGRQGWQHLWADAGYVPLDHDPLEIPLHLKWFTRRTKRPQLRPLYMLALLSGKLVRHFDKSIAYRAICGLEPPARRRKLRCWSVDPSANVDVDAEFRALDDKPSKQQQVSQRSVAQRRSPSPMPSADCSEVSEDSELESHYEMESSSEEELIGAADKKGVTLPIPASSSIIEGPSSGLPSSSGLASSSGPASSSIIEGPVLASSSGLTRQRRGTPFGSKWMMASYKAGWGATCYHKNASDDTQCKKNFTNQFMSSKEIRTRMMMWCLMGETIDKNAEDARTQHLEMNDFKTCPLWDEELIETLADE